jgi:hypothetical protein
MKKSDPFFLEITALGKPWDGKRIREQVAINRADIVSVSGVGQVEQGVNGQPIEGTVIVVRSGTQFLAEGDYATIWKRLHADKDSS